MIKMLVQNTSAKHPTVIQKHCLLTHIISKSSVALKKLSLKAALNDKGNKAKGQKKKKPSAIY